MDNFVLSTKPNKINAITNFMNSRDIIHTFLRDSQELYDALLTGTCNLIIFDYHLDMSIINTIRDLMDNANTIRVFVTCIEHAQPYLALTKDVYILPDEFNVMSYFWDSDACRADNVMAFDSCSMSNVKLMKPSSLGQTKHLVVDIGSQQIPLRYKTADGRIIQSKNHQIVLSCKAKSIDLAGIFKTRDQSEIYTKRHRDLGYLPVAAAEPENVEEPATPVMEKVIETPQTSSVEHIESPKIKAKPDRRTNGVATFFEKVRFKPKEEPIAEQSIDETVYEEEPCADEVTEQPSANVAEEVTVITEQEPATKRAPTPIRVPSPVSFTSFTGGQNARTTSIKRRKISIDTTCDTIAEYCLTNGFITHEDHDKLILGIQSSREYSKDAQFGDLALKQGLITEEQLIEAISAVTCLEVLPWKVVSEMKIDLSLFSLEKCKHFKFFKLEDTSSSGNVEVVASASICALNEEVRKLFDSPRIRYTLDSFITRKLEDVSC